MKQFIFNISFFWLFILSSCQHSYKYPTVLTRIDSLSIVCPDSALKLLYNMEQNIAADSKSNQMYYKLLILKAKSYAYKSLAEDTVIYELVDYYRHTNNKNLLLQAYYYAGKVSRQRLNFIQAMNYFQKVIENSDNENLEIKSQAYSQLNYLYDQQWLDEDALEMCKASIKISKEINDTIHQIFSLRDMGGLYYDMDLHDSAYICYSTALKLAREQNNKEMESVVACQLARYYNHEKQFEIAKQYIQISLNYDDPNDRSGVFYNAANVYKGLGMMDSVVFYYKKLLEYGNVYTKKEAYKGLYQFYANKNQKQEEQYFFNEYVKYVDSVQNIRTTNIVKQNKNMYEYNKIEDTIHILKEQNKLYKIYTFILLSIIVIYLLIYVYKQKINYKMRVRKKQEINDKEPLYHLIESTDIYKHITDVLDGSIGKKHLTDADWQRLSDEINKIWPHFNENLNNLCYMNTNDYHICLLLKIKMPIKDISELTSMSYSGIGSVRTKLYERAFKEKKGASEWDNVIDSL